MKLDCIAIARYTHTPRLSAKADADNKRRERGDEPARSEPMAIRVWVARLEVLRRAC